MYGAVFGRSWHCVFSVRLPRNQSRLSGRVATSDAEPSPAPLSPPPGDKPPTGDEPPGGAPPPAPVGITPPPPAPVGSVPAPASGCSERSRQPTIAHATTAAIAACP